MRDESQLDEMRAAIRGDFERLEQRRGVQELMHVTEPETPLLGLEAADAPVPDTPQVSWLARLVAAIPPRQV